DVPVLDNPIAVPSPDIPEHPAGVVDPLESMAAREQQVAVDNDLIELHSPLLDRQELDLVLRGEPLLEKPGRALAPVAEIRVVLDQIGRNILLERLGSPAFDIADADEFLRQFRDLAAAQDQSPFFFGEFEGHRITPLRPTPAEAPPRRCGA